MHTRPDTVMLFTAGFGTRMRPLTDAMPKPLIEVAGRTLLDHALDVVRGAGLSRVVGNTHYLADMMEPALTARGVTPLHEPVILETGGGLRNARPVLGPGPVITLNADAVWTGPNPIDALLTVWDASRMDGLLLLASTQRATGHSGPGDFLIGEDGRLRRGRGPVYTGVQIIEPAVLDGIDEDVFSLNLAWDRMEQAGRLYGIVHQGGWCDVGQPDSIALAEDMLTNAHV